MNYPNELANSTLCNFVVSFASKCILQSGLLISAIGVVSLVNDTKYFQQPADTAANNGFSKKALKAGAAFVALGVAGRMVSKYIK